MGFEHLMLMTSGFTTAGCYEMVERIENYSGDGEIKLYCTKKTLIHIFDSHTKFGNHDIVGDDKFINDFKKQHEDEIREDASIIVIAPEKPDRPHGLIRLNDNRWR